MSEADIERAGQLIKGASDIVIISHERPDGDAVGSLLALTLSLQEAGNQVYPILEGGLPSRWKFLPGADQIIRAVPEGDHLIVTVDSADSSRLGLESPPQIHLNIDHHPSNTRYGTINLVDQDAASTTIVLYRLAPKLGLPISQAVAKNLLTGLVTDTIGFRTASVTPSTLQVAAELIDFGLDLSEIYRKSLIERSYEAIKLWGQGLAQMEREGDLIWTVLRVADRKAVGYPGRDDADLIDVLTTVDDAKVAVIFVEEPDGHVKMSFRARPGVDVSSLAAQFNGGGHTLAAGARIEGTLNEVVERVIKATQAAMTGTK